LNSPYIVPTIRILIGARFLFRKTALRLPRIEYARDITSPGGVDQWREAAPGQDRRGAAHSMDGAEEGREEGKKAGKKGGRT